MVISALRTLDTGQFFSAVRANSSNLSRSIPGTCARGSGRLRNPETLALLLE